MNTRTFLLLAFVSFSSLAVFHHFTVADKTAPEPKTVLVRVSVDSENAGYEAYRAMDGDAGTMWHSQFNLPPNGQSMPHPISCGYGYACGYDHRWQAEEPAVEDAENDDPWCAVRKENNAACPHELRIDLGGVFMIEGFRYTPRADGQPNGTIADYELYISSDPDAKLNMGDPVVKGKFEGDKTKFEIMFERPIESRLMKFVALSEKNGQPFTSIAEFEPICDGVKFVVAQNPDGNNAQAHLVRMPNVSGDPKMQERIDEWNLLTERLKNRTYWQAIKGEVYDDNSLIHPEDRDPLDVALRRMKALFKESRSEDIADLSDEKLFDVRVEKIPIEKTDDRFRLFKFICDAKAVIFAEQLMDEAIGAREILFVKRHRSTYQHMCDQFYGRTQRPGGGLFVLTIPEDGNITKVAVRNLLENSVVENGRLKGKKLEGGSFLSPDVSFDGKKIAFAYVECTGPSDHFWHLDVTKGHWDIGRSYHIFTCNSDGSELRQITDGTWNDFDPCWLPNGRVAFISERRNGYLRCGRECPTYTLYDMNPDGTKMRCLSYHETNEWNPSVTNDGKILYTRWDYVDRYGCIVHHPWLTSLDGRDPREVHGNYSHRHRRADAEFDCRAIPGSPKYIATGGPHHGQSYGSLIIIDPRVEDDDAMGPVKRITPDVGFPESQGGGEVYGTPWALNEKFFLCVADFAYQPGAGIPGAARGRGNDGIYIGDVFGNRELLYRDPEIACISPMPLKARPVPPVQPDLIDPEDIVDQPYVGIRENVRSAYASDEEARKIAPKTGEPLTGTMSLVNVYDSLRPFPEATKIKELRIIQLLPMSVPSGAPPHHTGKQEASSLDSVNIARAVLGTVPVEPDGSAHFELPAEIEFQFQAIDEDGLAVQSMRSSSYLQPGENLSCNGCHEQKLTAPVRYTVQPQAFSRPASKIVPENVPGAYPFSYPRLVQPVLDQHCVDCHAKPESKTFSLAKEPIRNRFYESYNNLVSKYGFTNYGDPLRTTPGKFGAKAAPLYKILKDGHYDVKLSDEEMHRIVLWLDCISNFYGVYEKEGGEAQLRGEVVFPTLE